MAEKKKVMKSKVCKLEDTPVAGGHAQDSNTTSNVNSETEGSYTVIHEAISADDGAQNFIMRHIEQGPGRASRGHAHVWEHEIFVLYGEGVAIIEKEEFKIGKDSVVYFAPNEWHQIRTEGDKPLCWITVIPVNVHV